MLNPPCPEEALGEPLVGFDLDSPLISELEALFERFRRNTDLPDMWEQALEREALEDQWIDLRQRALGHLRKINSLQVPAATLLAWFQQSAQWTNLARSDFHWALGLWRKMGDEGTLYITYLTGPNGESTQIESFSAPTFCMADPNEQTTSTTMVDSPEDTEEELVELSQAPEDVARRQREELIRAGYLGSFDKAWSPCPADEVLQNTLAASDAMLAIWEVCDPPTWASLALPESKEDHLATPGALLGTRIMEDGELLEDNDNYAKYYRNEFLQVRGNAWTRFECPRLSEAQKGYVETFYSPDSDHWPRTPEPSQALSEAVSAKLELKPVGLQGEDEDDLRLIITPQPSSAQWPAWGTYLHASLHEAAKQAGWTQMDAVNGNLFLEALKTERLTGAFALYPGNDLMHLPIRCAVAPSDEVIIETLRNMLVAGRASDASPRVFPSGRDLLTEVRRLRESIRVLPAVQPIQKPGRTDAYGRD